jgi:glycosyltransferase involved in cell wall biosynthesis
MSQVEMENPKTARVLFSVVIATYNVEKTLESCLNSLRGQTFRDFEILVADGVSTDRTREILRSRTSEISVLVSEKDRGIYDAWNKVIPRARGQWLIFLGADDELFDEKVFERVAAALLNVSEKIVYGKVAIVLPNGETLNTEGKEWEKISKKFLQEMTIPHQGVFHRRDLFETRGLFDPSFKVCGDYEFLLRELKENSAKFLPDITVSKMGFGGTSSTLKNVPTIISELSRARSMNGLSAGSPFIYSRWIRYYLRNGISRVFGVSAANWLADCYRVLTGRPKLWTRDRGE